MRVLFVTWAWPSHYFPMVPLAWAMRSAGHEVRMASQPELVPTMVRSGLPVVAVGRDFDIAAIHRSAMLQLRTEPARSVPAGRIGTLVPDRRMSGPLRRAMQAVRPDADGLSLFGAVADAMVDDLVEFTAGWRPDLVVFDPLTYAAPIAARLAGIPAVRHLFGPDVNYFSHQGEAERLAPVLSRFGLSEVELLGALSVDPTPPSLQFPPAAAPFDRLPMRYVPYNGLSHVPRWVDRPGRRTRICLTWGTSTARLVGDDGFVPAALVRACARLAADRDSELVLAIVAGQRELLGAVPDGVTVAESVPLRELLPTCNVLIHQGGAGTTLTGLLCGLPQLIVSQLSDQAINAANLVGTGAGSTLTVGEADEPAGYDAVRRLLDEPGYRAAAGRLRAEMLDQPTPADLVDKLGALVDRGSPQ